MFADEVVDITRSADLFVVNLECCISERGTPWPDPRKPFFFRAPPAATEVLNRLGVDCVTLANNHALDFGPVCLLDTLEHLRAARIAYVGAGRRLEEARAPAVLEAAGLRLGVLGLQRPSGRVGGGTGVAGDRVRRPATGSRLAARRDRPARCGCGARDPALGADMILGPLPYVRRAAAALRAAGATLIAGHSAHVFHGVEPGILYDLGDFIDDYAVDPRLRNDLGLLFLVTFDEHGPRRVEAIPLKLEFCYTRLARRRACGSWRHQRRTRNHRRPSPLTATPPAL